MKPYDPSLALFQSLGVFADWRLPTDEEIRFAAEELEFQVIILGIAKAKGRGWHPRLKTPAIVERFGACREAGLEPFVMPWLVRRVDAVEAVCDWLLDHFADGDASIFDAEEDVYRGSMAPLAMAETIADSLDGRLWGVTGIGNLHRSVAPLARLSGIVCPQCYPFWRPTKDKHWSHSRATFPGPQQDQGFERWSEVNPEARFAMGLGCYWGKRPASGMTPALSASHTMRFAAVETAALGVYESWYWSLKWLMESGVRGDEVRGFFGA